MTVLIDALNGVLWNYILIYGLLAVGILFTFRLGFLQLRHFPEFFRVISKSETCLLYTSPSPRD